MTKSHDNKTWAYRIFITDTLTHDIQCPRHFTVNIQFNICILRSPLSHIVSGATETLVVITEQIQQ